LQSGGGNLVIAVAHQNAPTLFAAAPNATAELMQRRQTEPFRLQDHHHAGCRNINPHLDDGRTNKYVRFSGNERLHGNRAFRGTLLPMYDPNSSVWEPLSQQFRLGFNPCRASVFAIVIERRPLLWFAPCIGVGNSWNNDECLPTGGHLFIHKRPDTLEVGAGANRSADRLAPRGKGAKL
jgi:hypothetical protein